MSEINEIKNGFILFYLRVTSVEEQSHQTILVNSWSNTTNNFTLYNWYKIHEGTF